VLKHPYYSSQYLQVGEDPECPEMAGPFVGTVGPTRRNHVTVWFEGQCYSDGAFPFQASAVQVSGSATGAHSLIGVRNWVIELSLIVVSLVWTVAEIAHK